MITGDFFARALGPLALWRRERQKTTIAWEFLAISDGGGGGDDVQPVPGFFALL